MFDTNIPPITIPELPKANEAKVSDQIEVDQDGASRSITVGQITARATAEAVAQAVAAVNRIEIISPYHYGARGDGVTDDTAAFQAAVNAAANNMLYVPPGTYLLASYVYNTPCIRLPPTITIVGAGDASVLKTVSDAPMLHYEGTGPGIGGAGIHIRHLKFLGDSGPGLLQAGMSIRGATDISVLDNTFINIGARCISVTYSHDNSFVAKRVQITGNRIDTVGDAGIFIKTAVEQLVISDNTIENMGTAGSQPGFTNGITIDDASGSQLPIQSTNITVTGNIIKNALGDDRSFGILTSGGENIVIANNVLTDMGSTSYPGFLAAIRVSRGTGPPNLISKRVLVTGNVITNTGSHAITLNYAQHCSVLNNHIVNWGCNAISPGALTAGVFLENESSNNVVSGNVLVGGTNSKSGVTVWHGNCNDNLVWGNFVIENGLTIEEVHDNAATTVTEFNPQGQISKTLPGVTLLMHGSSLPTALATTGTQYLSTQGNLAPQATNTSAWTTFLDRDIRVRRWRIVLSNAPGVGMSRTFTVQRASADTAITLTVADAVTSAIWTGDVMLGFGNWITIKSVATGTATAALATFVMEYSV